VPKARKVFSEDGFMWQKVQTLIRRHAERTTSDQSMFFSFFRMLSFPRWRHNLWILVECFKTLNP